MDQDGKVLPEHRHFVLRSLMVDCTDFQHKKSAMELLIDDLNLKAANNQTLKIIVSPKYHCELAGDGIEYAWGLMKRVKYFTWKTFLQDVLDICLLIWESIRAAWQ